MASVKTSSILETHTAYLMGLMLGGISRADSKAFTKQANWTAKGSEAIIEHYGIFYKITIEPVKP